MGSLDWTVFHWLNGPAGKHGWLDHAGKFAAAQLSVMIVVTLIVGWLVVAGIHLWQDRELPRGLIVVILAAGVSLALAFGTNQVIGHIWFRPRPYTSHASAHLIVAPSPDPSFASDHAVAGFALAFGSVTQLPRVAALVFMETLVMSGARVYVGLHYPGDILGALLVGPATAFLVLWVLGRVSSVIERAVAVANGYAGRWGLPVRIS